MYSADDFLHKILLCRSVNKIIGYGLLPTTVNTSQYGLYTEILRPINRIWSYKYILLPFYFSDVVWSVDSIHHKLWCSPLSVSMSTLKVVLTFYRYNFELVYCFDCIPSLYIRLLSNIQKTTYQRKTTSLLSDLDITLFLDNISRIPVILQKIIKYWWKSTCKWYA